MYWSWMRAARLATALSSGLAACMDGPLACHLSRMYCTITCKPTGAKAVHSTGSQSGASWCIQCLKASTHKWGAHELCNLQVAVQTGEGAARHSSGMQAAATSHRKRQAYSTVSRSVLPWQRQSLAAVHTPRFHKWMCHLAAAEWASAVTKQPDSTQTWEAIKA